MPVAKKKHIRFFAKTNKNPLVFLTFLSLEGFFVHNRQYEEWGELVGEIGFEVLLQEATAGGASALTALKVADKTVDVARAVDKLDNLGDTSKTADKIEDISDGPKLPKAPEELGDVVHKKIRGKPLIFNP